MRAQYRTGASRSWPAPGRATVPGRAERDPGSLARGLLVNVFLRDISERRRAEEASRQLAAIVESSDDAIISKDLNALSQLEPGSGAALWLHA